MRIFLLPLIIIIVVIFTAFIVVRNQTNKQSRSDTDLQTASEITTQHPVTECTGQAIPPLTDGPYYTPNTPEKNDFSSDNAPGTKLVLTGLVYDTDCKPISNAWIDFWQADGEGNYDNSGYKLRGHQYTDESGKYTLITVVPGEYPGRTPHIHVKLRATDTSPIITSQLFMPGESQNETDSIFDEALIMNVTDNGSQRNATYNFVIERS